MSCYISERVICPVTRRVRVFISCVLPTTNVIVQDTQHTKTSDNICFMYVQLERETSALVESLVLPRRQSLVPRVLARGWYPIHALVLGLRSSANGEKFIYRKLVFNISVYLAHRAGGKK